MRVLMLDLDLRPPALERFAAAVVRRPKKLHRRGRAPRRSHRRHGLWLRLPVERAAAVDQPAVLSREHLVEMACVA